MSEQATEKVTRKPSIATYAKRLRKAVEDFNEIKGVLNVEGVDLRYEIGEDGDLEVGEMKIVKVL